MSKYLCTRCGGEEEASWTDYYVHTAMGIPPLCARCDPKQRCHFHLEAEPHAEDHGGATRKT